MNTITEPNWDSLGDKEIAAIIRSRTGEEVVPGNMAHAVLVERAQAAFRHGAHETKPEVKPVAATAAQLRDTAPKGGHHSDGDKIVAGADAGRTKEIAESASGNPLTQAHPEGRAIGHAESADRAAPKGGKKA
jgi:hypothetical protein